MYIWPKVITISSNYSIAKKPIGTETFLNAKVIQSANESSKERKQKNQVELK